MKNAIGKKSEDQHLYLYIIIVKLTNSFSKVFMNGFSGKLATRYWPLGSPLKPVCHPVHEYKTKMEFQTHRLKYKYSINEQTKLCDSIS